ncbi:VPLPA-CTERM sorting domain-containing protein [uncultured Roseobacter sp.]|uniref:VPLPA-CTERM sorting domain-containing protein n=1 Tax=uncultured Roseobacter sp. TaxID=114847 RepID=UPI00260EFA6A|nr:VPLPA-CTERM sorting domain-containing protein [uncultured Roseobacter sp.]
MSTTVIGTQLQAETVSSPDIFQIGVSGLAIQQDILVTGVGAPWYQDPETGDFIFFDEYSRILNEEANVFDPDQIPTSPIGADSVVSSTASLTGAWTFDASVLAQDLTVFTDQDGTELGTSDQVSTFRVTRDGETVGGGTTGSTSVFVANNVVVGTRGETLDLIAIVAGRSPGFDFDSGMPGSSGVQLVLSGGPDWFEDAAGAIPDFSEVIIGAADYEEYVFGEFTDDEGVRQSVPLYEERIVGAITSGDQIFINQFGAADGSSETSPLLPTGSATVTDGDDGEPLSNPVFGFDVAGATAVDVDGVDIVFVDPLIAVGYTYELTGAGEILGILAPTLAAVGDADGYLVTANGVTFRIEPGEYYAFADNGVLGAVTSLLLSDIDPSLMIDPADATTFVAGFAFAGEDSTTGFTQQATVVDTDVAPVPLPAGMSLMLGAMALLGGAKLRRRQA